MLSYDTTIFIFFSTCHDDSLCVHIRTIWRRCVMVKTSIFLKTFSATICHFIDFFFFFFFFKSVVLPWGILLMSEKKKSHGLAGVTFSEHKSQRSKLLQIAQPDLWPVFHADWTLHCSWVTPSVPFLFCSSFVPLRRGVVGLFLKLETTLLLPFLCSNRAPSLILVWLDNGWEGRTVVTAWQMHNRVLFRVPSNLIDWPTRGEWTRKSLCVRKTTSNRNRWVLSEGVGTKRHKCLVSNLAQLALCPFYYLLQGFSSCLTLHRGISFMKRMESLFFFF